MPRFYFHLCEGDGVLLDEEGLEMPADGIAPMCLREARALIACDAAEGVIDLAPSIDVADEDGRTVHSLDFTDAVRIKMPS